MLYRTCILFIIAVFSFIIKGKAQQLPLINLQIRDGLPSNTVYGIYGARNGALWIATDKGVARYNGSKMELFTTFDGLPDNEVFSMLEDDHGRLWFSCFSGKLCFLKDGRFHTQDNTPWLKLRKTAVASYYNLEPDHTLTMLQSGGRDFINIDEERISQFSLAAIRAKANIIGNTIIAVKKDAPNRYRLYTQNRNLVIDTAGNILSMRNYTKSQSYWPGPFGTDIVLCSIQGIFDLNERPLWLLDGIGKVERRAFFADNTNRFLGTANGLFVNGKTKVLNGISITTIGKHRGSYWIGTKENGLYILNDKLEDFAEWPKVYSGKVVRAEINGGTPYFITENGDYRRMGVNGPELLYSYQGKLKNSLSHTQFSIRGEDGYLAVSRLISYAVIRSGPGRAFQFRSIPGFWASEEEDVKELLTDNEHLYIVSIGGIISINLTELDQRRYDKAQFLLKSDGINSRIYSRALNKLDSTLWFSRSNGMFKLSDTVIRKEARYSNYIFRKFLMFSNYLAGLTTDNKLIIANTTLPVGRIDSVTIENCIWENIYPIDDSHAIISTNNYYRLLSIKGKHNSNEPPFTIQTLENSFIPLQAEAIAATSGYVYFFKEGNITRIRTTALFEQEPPPTPLFSQIKIRNRALPLRKELDLSYNESANISISFDNVSFSGKEIDAQYSVSSTEADNWQAISGNEINLNSPGYGTVIIKIRSRTLSSKYSLPAVLTLHIAKPYWATWWFITLCALVLLGMIWSIIVFVTWRKLRKKQKEHDADMKYQQSEYKALNALMNPHFIFNSLNNIQGLINKDEKRTANEYLVIFSDLVRQNMHNISKGFISLKEELKLIENYLTLEKLRFKDLVNYEIHVAEDVDAEDLMIPPLMIQPLVENAVKHGLLPKQSSLSRVVIQVYEQNNTIFVIIDDNGIGLSQALTNKNKLHDSFGLSNLRKRTEHLKKIQQHEVDIEVNDRIAPDGSICGTRAVVKIRFH